MILLTNFNFSPPPRQGFLSFWAMCFLASFSVFSARAVAQPVTSEDMASLNLGRIDQLLEDIRQQVDLVRFGSDNLGQTEQINASDSSSSDSVAVAPDTFRSRANALCFADSPSGLNSAADLEGFFTGLEKAATAARTTIGSFTDMQSITSEGECEDFMIGMLSNAQSRLETVEANDLNGLVLHLQECWPDEGILAEDGTDVNVDSYYVRARQLRTTFSNNRRRLEDSIAWCGS